MGPGCRIRKAEARPDPLYSIGIGPPPRELRRGSLRPERLPPPGEGDEELVDRFPGKSPEETREEPEAKVGEEGEGLGLRTLLGIGEDAEGPPRPVEEAVRGGGEELRPGAGFGGRYRPGFFFDASGTEAGLGAGRKKPKISRGRASAPFLGAVVPLEGPTPAEETPGQPFDEAAPGQGWQVEQDAALEAAAAVAQPGGEVAPVGILGRLVPGLEAQGLGQGLALEGGEGQTPASPPP